MAKLSLSEVSNRFNVSRSTLYRAIKEGRISRSADGLFDIAEVIRCFGEPIKKHEPNQVITSPKDDADLRQLVDFMRKEIESYKDREKRYLDQIDRFQLLLGHKESEEKMSHDTPNRHFNETPCDNNDDSSVSIENKSIDPNSLSHDTVTRHTSGAPKNVSQTHHETRKKRGLFGRVLNAVFDND
ncbi:plasmid replication DNA-binding protein [Acinetobacter indicus]|uniref:plasmid replication DNA-binding protein n=1 Tax=Acinetobacter indicus TaxID=756892 RepID=UPI002578DA04|nr:plasmid replication DNA-binding protein [Acinetobacter indicus]MDM1772615.1 DNA-binding protein [Acinetobacter indicus]MDM1775411.1 DNA-binding protein [Acinetobacter indicus]